MFTSTKAYSAFAVDDVPKAREFYAQTLGIAWFRDPAGNVLSVLQKR